jgi:hypothetical protein
MLKKSFSKKFKQKRANANTHKSQTKLISRFIKKIVVAQKKFIDYQ